MSKNTNRIILLYKKMLEITEKEHAVIKENNYEKMEKYCSAKEDLLKEIEALKKSDDWISTPDEGAEMESVLLKILVMNNANAEAVRDMKKSTLKETEVRKNR